MAKVIPLRHIVLATKDGRAVRPEYRPRIDTVDGPPAWLDAVCKLFLVVMAVASVAIWVLS